MSSRRGKRANLPVRTCVYLPWLSAVASCCYAGVSAVTLLLGPPTRTGRKARLSFRLQALVELSGRSSWVLAAARQVPLMTGMEACVKQPGTQPTAALPQRGCQLAQDACRIVVDG